MLLVYFGVVVVGNGQTKEMALVLDQMGRMLLVVVDIGQAKDYLRGWMLLDYFVAVVVGKGQAMEVALSPE